jgi:hypothetical protein
MKDRECGHQERKDTGPMWSPRNEYTGHKAASGRGGSGREAVGPEALERGRKAAGVG